MPLRVSPDKDDADFVALALKVNAPLWSNNRRLKEIREI
ncbi:PIN domain-containing protein [Thermococcus sp.]